MKEYPFEVQAFLDRVEVVAADMSCFTPGAVQRGMRNGEECLLTHVYAPDEYEAILLAASLNPVSHEAVQALLDERRKCVENASYKGKERNSVFYARVATKEQLEKEG